MSNESVSIRQAIASEVARQGRSQGELSAKTGIAQAHISEFLRGRRDWNTRTADRLLTVLGLVVLRKSSRHQEPVERRHGRVDRSNA